MSYGSYKENSFDKDIAFYPCLLKVYSILDSGNDNIVSRKEVDANIEKVLLMFRKSLKSSLKSASAGKH